MRPQGVSQETPGHVQPHSLLRESVTSGAFTGQSLASWVDLPGVLDVPGVLDGDPVLRLQARGARPGDMGNPKQALPHGRELCSPSLESTHLRTRSATSNVLERTMRQSYCRSACWYLATRSKA